MKISFRSMAWSIIVSGLFGVIAYGFLMYAVLGRSSGALNQPGYVMMFNLHDAVAMFQFLFLIPLVSAFHNLSVQGDSAMSRTTRLTRNHFNVFRCLYPFTGISRCVIQWNIYFSTGHIWRMAHSCLLATSRFVSPRTPMVWNDHRIGAHHFWILHRWLHHFR